MSIQDIVTIIQNDWGSWLVVFVIVASLIEITPIKINPWSLVMNFIGKQINKDTIDRLEKLEEKLDLHIKESDVRDIKSTRRMILDFANACMNNRKHSQEEFEFIIGECDKYEKHCIENNIVNGVAKDGINEIHRIYTECRKNNSFLKGGVADEEI